MLPPRAGRQDAGRGPQRLDLPGGGGKGRTVGGGEGGGGGGGGSVVSY